MTEHIDGYTYDNDPFDIQDELTLEGEPSTKDLTVAQFGLALQRIQFTLDTLKSYVVDEDPQDCLSEEQAMLLAYWIPILLGSIEDD